MVSLFSRLRGRRRKRQMYFRRIIKSLWLFIGVIALVCVCVCVYVCASLTQTTREKHRSAIVETADEMTRDFYELQQISYLLMANIKYEDYIAYYIGAHGATPDYISLNKLREILAIAASTKEEISRILVYSPKNGLIVSNTGIYNYDEYYRLYSQFTSSDNEVYRNTEQFDYFKVYPTRALSPSNGGEGSAMNADRVVPIGISLLDLHAVDASILINLGEDKLLEKLESGFFLDNMDAVILDSYGNLVTGTIPELSDAGNDAREPLEMAENGESVVIEGKRYVAFYDETGIPAWRVVYLTPYWDYYHPVINALILFVLVISAIVVCCVLLSYYVCNRLYNPIANLVSLTRDSAASAAPVMMDEMKFIQDHFAVLNQAKESLVDRLSKTENALHSHIIMQILMNDDDSVSALDVSKAMREFNFQMERPSFCLAIFNICYKPSFFSDFSLDVQKMIQKAITLLVLDHLRGFGDARMIPFEDSRSLIIVNDDSPSCAGALKEILIHINRLMQADQSYIQFFFSVSGTYHDFFSLSREFRRQKTLCDFYRLDESSPVVEDATVDLSTECYLSEQLFEHLKKMVLSDNQKEAAAILETIFVKNFSESATPYRFKKVYGILWEIHEKISNEIGEGHDFTSQLRSFGTANLFDADASYEIFRKAFLELCVTSREQLFKGQTFQKYIQNNYRDVNLNLQIMADAFHFNPNYLSRLFKEQTGSTFSDYISDMRIDHAKQLILETSMQIDDVSKNVGIASRRTFNRLFKKKTGFSPGVYRVLNQ